MCSEHKDVFIDNHIVIVSFLNICWPRDFIEPIVPIPVPPADPLTLSFGKPWQCFESFGIGSDKHTSFLVSFNVSFDNFEE